MLREADVRLRQGETAGSVRRAIGVTEQTCCRRRREFGGLKVDQANRLTDVERENEPLRRHRFEPNGERASRKRSPAVRRTR
ncbi:MAG: hypothetical protein MI723_17630 [Caulobacterales bacterium]|nr:hypothetical protein [Caulobacterales bacterium]